MISSRRGFLASLCLAPLVGRFLPKRWAAVDGCPGVIDMPSQILCMQEHNGYLYIGCEDGVYMLDRAGNPWRVDARRVHGMAKVGSDLALFTPTETCILRSGRLNALSPL